MIKTISPKQFYDLNQKINVIDVRSPGENHIGHIPGSHSIPLLDDEQRKEVGTIYKKKGREKAIELALGFVGPSLVEKLRLAKSFVKENRLIVYCWRGGMRSNSMAWLFSLAGVECYVVEGGYKALRNYGKEKFSEAREVYVIGGYTGSAKTKVLYELENLGEQILDIEKEAHHRGSSFGAIGQEAQIPNEQFENNLIQKWMQFDSKKRIWLEDESKILGSNHIPEGLYQRIRNSKVFELNIDIEKRAENLVEDYASLEKEKLEEAIRRIERKLGGKLMKEAIEALEENNFAKVATISLMYYDKTYSYGLSKRAPESITSLDKQLTEPDDIATFLIATVEGSAL